MSKRTIGREDFTNGTLGQQRDELRARFRSLLDSIPRPVLCALSAITRTRRLVKKTMENVP
jgi:hypothetical protein